jgi:uncharacterized protein
MPWLEIAVGAAMLLGLVGTVVPVLPGLAVVWLAGLVYGLTAGFGTAGTVAFTVMTVLALLGTAAKFGLPARSGAQRGARGPAVTAAVVGALLGALILPVFGLPVGAVIGVWAAERARLGDPAEAWRTTVEIVRSLGVGILVEFTLGTVMLATWLVWLIAAD